MKDNKNVWMYDTLWVHKEEIKGKGEGEFRQVTIY